MGLGPEVLQQKNPELLIVRISGFGQQGPYRRRPGFGTLVGLVFEMEHGPYDIGTLRNCLQYLLNRRQILEAKTLAPAVTPMVRIPPNGSEMNQWVAKQVLDSGVYGIVWPHVSTVEEARKLSA